MNEDSPMMIGDLLEYDLALLTAAERSRLVDEFIAETFGERQDPSGIGERMREATHALPDDPTPEQLDAWVEVARLVQDPSFRRRVCRMAQAGEMGDEPVDRQSGQEFAAKVAELAGPAADKECAGATHLYVWARQVSNL